MKRKHIFLIFLVCTLFAVGCNAPPTAPDVPPVSDQTIAEPADTTAAPAPLPLTVDGACRYIIVRPENGSPAEIEAAAAIRRAIEKRTGTEVTLRSDLLLAGRAPDAATYEILVGQTSYPQSETAYASLDYGGFSVQCDGNKLVVAGVGDVAIDKAADALIGAITRESGVYVLPADLALGGIADPISADLPAFPATLEALTDGADDSQIARFAGVTAEAYDAYLAELRALGYTDEWTNTQNGNRRDALVNTDRRITAALELDGELRLIIEPYTAPLESTPEATVCTPSLTMLGLGVPTAADGSGEPYTNGLGMIWKLSDGSLLVVDGGGKNDVHARLLYETMRELAPDPDNIVISAWLLTHPHIDHVGTLIRFAPQYASKVTVKAFIFNFPTEAFIQAIAAAADDTDSTQAQMALQAQSAMRLFQGAKQIKAHIGQRFTLAGAEVEILHTVEAIHNANSGNGNATSQVFMVTVNDCRTLVTGDAITTVSDRLATLYGQTLRCDILQMNHHGFGGATKTFYGYARPTYAFCPASTATYERVRSRDYNRYLLEELGAVLYLAAGTNRTIALSPIS